MGKRTKVWGVLHNDNCTVSLCKKPSINEIKKQKDKIAKSLREPEIANYDEEYYVVDPNGEQRHIIEKASEKHFGIFNKRGYRALKLFHTREEAEIELSTWKRPDFYDIREIEWFEEDKEK